MKFNFEEMFKEFKERREAVTQMTARSRSVEVKAKGEIDRQALRFWCEARIPVAREAYIKTAGKLIEMHDNKEDYDDTHPLIRLERVLDHLCSERGLRGFCGDVARDPCRLSVKARGGANAMDCQNCDKCDLSVKGKNRLTFPKI